jgi:hypothetical protein
MRDHLISLNLEGLTLKFLKYESIKTNPSDFVADGFLLITRRKTG